MILKPYANKFNKLFKYYFIDRKIGKETIIIIFFYFLNKYFVSSNLISIIILIPTPNRLSP